MANRGLVKEKDKARLIMYCLEFCFVVAGIVFLVLALLDKGCDRVPKGGQISSACCAIAFGIVPFLAEKLFKYHLPLMLHIIYFIYCLASNIIGSNLGVFRYEVLIFGEMQGVYDKVMHAILGYVLCIVAMYLAIKTKIWGKNKSGDVLIILAISMGFASLWEIFEFSADHIIPGQDMQRGSLVDTMLDMMSHFVLTIVFIVQYLIEKLAKVNLGIGYMERNLATGGKVKKQSTEEATKENSEQME